MRPWTLLIALLFVGAVGEQLMVQVTFDGEARIGEIETVEGGSPDASIGDWSLVLLDEDGDMIEQASFGNTLRTYEGTLEPLDEIWVSLPARATAQRVILYDPQGVQHDAKTIQSRCGDGLCQDGEEEFCSQDCPAAQLAQEAAAVQMEPLETVDSGNWRAWGIAGSTLLVIILVLVLVHINRKKENPVQLDTN